MAESSRNVLLKRLRQDSNDEEVMCQRCDNLTKERVMCTGCKLNFCLRCANISATLWQCITKGELDNFLWSCKSCRATFPSLDNISKVLGDIQTTTNSRMENFEQRLNTIEERTKADITSSVMTMKTEIIESLQSNLESLVDSRTKELDDRKRRDVNLVLFNVPEHHHPKGEDNKRGDIEDIQRLSSSLGLDNLQVTACFRLGKKKPNLSRPLKLVLDMKSQKRFLLDNAKFVPDKAPVNLKKVIIVRDLTPTQREERRKRRGRIRNAEPEVEPAVPDNLQNQNVSSMDTGDIQLPSPIPRNSVNDTNLTHHNIHSSTTVFGDSTVIDQQIDAFGGDTIVEEATVIGGLSDDPRSTTSTTPNQNY